MNCLRSLRDVTRPLALFAAVVVSSLLAHEAYAQAPSPVADGASAEERKLSLIDHLDTLGRIYKNDNNELLQELWFLGRYHGQLYGTDATTGSDSGYETRRHRLGFQGRFLRQLTLHAQMVSGSDFDPFYNGFTDLWAQWEFSPELELTIGQQKHRFTHDRNVSSRYMNYLERAMLTNMFAADYTPAVTIQGTIKDVTYFTGLFSNATGQNVWDNFTQLDSGYSYLAALYYDLGEQFGIESVTLYGSYLHSSANENATNLNRFDDGVSAAVIATHGAASLITELTAGLGSEEGNAVGINIQPTYFLSRKWQIATRYQLAASNDEQGLQPQRRYEREVNLQPGDIYQAGYGGINYYIAEHHLKLMSGIEYSSMNNDDEAWTVSAMIRFYFGPSTGGAFPMNQILPLAHD